MNNGCVAHRGFSSKAPENTIAAMDMAMAEPYVNWVEVDVQMSKDGVPVLIHDYTLKRTTNGRGSVKETTWADMQLLDAGRWKSKNYTGERIPSLDEFLNRVQGRLHANIEIKNSSNVYPGLERKVIEEIRSRNMLNNVVLTSFDAQTLTTIRELDDTIRIGLITDGKSKNLVSTLQHLQCSFLSIGYRGLDANLVAELNQQDILIMAWTIDKSSTMRRIANLHKDIMICTNRPDVWRDTFVTDYH